MRIAAIVSLTIVALLAASAAQATLARPGTHLLVDAGTLSAG